MRVKLEKVASRDATRPVLTHAFLRVDGERATLEACDSYKLARIPVELEAGDEEGFVPVEALTTARKARAESVSVNGSVDIPGGPSFPRPELGQFPNAVQLFPDGEVAFAVGVNAKFLHELAQGLGSETVRLEFVKVGDEPSALRPIVVRPIGGDAPEADGLLMPVRLAS